MKTKLNTTQKLVLSAIMMALYIAILFVSQAISLVRFKCVWPLLYMD